MRMLGSGFIAFLLSIGLALSAGLSEDDMSPRYNDDGDLLLPDGFESWVFVGSSLGLTYAAEPPSHDMFHNVYMQPWAYEHFMDAGEFAENTMFVLALYEASQEADPAQRGFYEGELASAMEIHLKQAGAHETGWTFHGFSAERESGMLFPEDGACYECHAERTERDHVFVQFYPTLREKLESLERTDH